MTHSYNATMTFQKNLKNLKNTISTGKVTMSPNYEFIASNLRQMLKFIILIVIIMEISIYSSAKILFKEPDDLLLLK